MKLSKNEVVKHIATETTHFIELKDLKKTQIFYEGNALTKNIELLVMTVPRKSKNGWSAKVQNTRGKIIDIFVSNDTNYPKPDFYLERQNIEERTNQIKEVA